MKTTAMLVMTLALGGLSTTLTACGNSKAYAGDSDWVFKPDPATEEELALIKLCGRPALPKKQLMNVQYQNLPGVDPQLQSLDIYMPAVLNPCQGVPVVIWVHGGGWKIGDKSNINHKAEYFNGLGYAFVSVNYRLSPKENSSDPGRTKFPDHPNDVGAAVAWVSKSIKSHGGNPEKLALLGHSAGAHLAALVGTQQSYISKTHNEWNRDHLRCVGSYDTEGYDIPLLMKDPEVEQRAMYLNAFGDDPAVWAVASPINHVQVRGPKFQLVKRGDAQRHAQVEGFKSELQKKLNFVTVIDGKGLSHSDVNRLIGAPDDRRMTPSVTEFMKKSCFPK
ncbi:MAG: alpha/beta hydrolase [Silvanigrellaceae bacterium]